ncbi:hypothetical protein GGX14DRAFT_400229 [Mycena pura]|uniref:Uncharacterized protein n=1 Tax=Mycena pura TaxID=153505 RepID=A0AAD6V2B1_9AGAR|nr:hypothetical protein GGX14DRAFT_400229 [Mycena pura]
MPFRCARMCTTRCPAVHARARWRPAGVDRARTWTSGAGVRGRARAVRGHARRERSRTRTLRRKRRAHGRCVFGACVDGLACDANAARGEPGGGMDTPGAGVCRRGIKCPAGRGVGRRWRARTAVGGRRRGRRARAGVPCDANAGRGGGGGAWREPGGGAWTRHSRARTPGVDTPGTGVRGRGRRTQGRGVGRRWGCGGVSRVGVDTAFAARGRRAFAGVDAARKGGGSDGGGVWGRELGGRGHGIRARGRWAFAGVDAARKGGGSDGGGVWAWKPGVDTPGMDAARGGAHGRCVFGAGVDGRACDANAARGEPGGGVDTPGAGVRRRRRRGWRGDVA